MTKKERKTSQVLKVALLIIAIAYLFKWVSSAYPDAMPDVVKRNAKKVTDVIDVIIGIAFGIGLIAAGLLFSGLAAAILIGAGIGFLLGQIYKAATAIWKPKGGEYQAPGKQAPVMMEPSVKTQNDYA